MDYTALLKSRCQNVPIRGGEKKPKQTHLTTSFTPVPTSQRYQEIPSLLDLAYTYHTVTAVGTRYSLVPISIKSSTRCNPAFSCLPFSLCLARNAEKPGEVWQSVLHRPPPSAELLLCTLAGRPPGRCEGLCPAARLGDNGAGARVHRVVIRETSALRCPASSEGYRQVKRLLRQTYAVEQLFLQLDHR